MKHYNYSPIIILGMHRSGTSLVTESLEKLGLFVGKRKDENHEAVFFRKLNEWLLRQCGSAWDEPQGIAHLLANGPVLNLTQDYLAHILRTPRAILYWGLKGYLSHHGFARIERPWGWKDPRNTFTLPIWRALFPEARIIHVSRHGVDVAHSVIVRQEQSLRLASTQHARRKWFYWVYPKRGGFTESVRCFDLDRSFSLWEEYMLEADRQVQGLEAYTKNIRYEDFLSDPVAHLRDLAKFCGLSVSEARLGDTARTVRTSRALAYRTDDSLRSYAERVAPRLKRLGY